MLQNIDGTLVFSGGCCPQALGSPARMSEWGCQSLHTSLLELFKRLKKKYLLPQ
jgi:hypothetical protein